MKLHLTGLSLFVALFTPVLAQAGDRRQEHRQLLGLGAFLGAERLEVLSWPVSGQIVRLSAPNIRDPRPSLGRFQGYEVLERVPLGSDRLSRLGTLLLDASIYDVVPIHRPARLGESIRGEGGRLCGGFNPAYGVELRADDGRIGHLLFCFSCDEIEFGDIRHGGGDERKVAEPARRYFTEAGAHRVLAVLAEAFPSDGLLPALLRDKRAWKRKGRPTKR